MVAKERSRLLNLVTTLHALEGGMEQFDEDVPEWITQTLDQISAVLVAKEVHELFDACPVCWETIDECGCEVWQRSIKSFEGLGGDKVRYGMAVINAYNEGSFNLESKWLHPDSKRVILVDRSSSQRLTREIV